MRNRARAWKPFRDWAVLTRGVTFPRHAADVVDYLEFRGLEPCGKTVPDSFIVSLALLEKLGKVPPDDLLASDPFVVNTVNFWRTTLQQSSQPPVKAEMFFVAMLISLELFVADVSFAVYDRAMAWLLLVMHWAAFRSDDVMGIDPMRLQINQVCLRGVVTQSKTTGAGRTTQEVPFFVARNASLAGVDWTALGYTLWMQWAWPRDFFPLHPNGDRSDVVRKYCDVTKLNAQLMRIMAVLPQVHPPDGELGWKRSATECVLLLGMLNF